MPSEPKPTEIERAKAWFEANPDKTKLSRKGETDFSHSYIKGRSITGQSDKIICLSGADDQRLLNKGNYGRVKSSGDSLDFLSNVVKIQKMTKNAYQQKQAQLLKESELNIQVGNALTEMVVRHYTDKEAVEQVKIYQELKNLGYGLNQVDTSKLTPPQQMLLAYNLLEKVEQLHQEHNIIHRDIKPDNIVVQPDGSISLIDFGHASSINEAGELGAVNFLPLREQESRELSSIDQNVLLQSRVEDAKLLDIIAVLRSIYHPFATDSKSIFATMDEIPDLLKNIIYTRDPVEWLVNKNYSIKQIKVALAACILNLAKSEENLNNILELQDGRQEEILDIFKDLFLKAVAIDDIIKDEIVDVEENIISVYDSFDPDSDSEDEDEDEDENENEIQNAQQFVSASAKLIRVNHVDFARVINGILGTDYSFKGVCYGFTSKLIDAFFQDDLKLFDKRLSIISGYIYNDNCNIDIGIKNLKDKVKNIRQQIKEGKTHELSEDDFLILEIPALMESILVQQMPDSFVEIQGESNINDQNYFANQSLVSSKQQGNNYSRHLLTIGSHALTRARLKKYLDQMQSILEKSDVEKVVIGLNANNHATSLIYSKENGLNFFDVNMIDSSLIQMTTDNAELVNLIFSAVPNRKTDDNNQYPLALNFNFFSETNSLELAQELDDLNKETYCSGDEFVRNNNDHTMFKIAAFVNNYQLIEELITNNKVNTNDNNGFYDEALCHACHYGCFESVKVLVEHGGELNAKLDGNKSTLYLAVKSNHGELVDFILDKIECVNFDKDNLRYDPINYALEHQKKSLCQKFLSKLKPDCLEAYQLHCSKLLESAVESNDISKVRFLLSINVEVADEHLTLAQSKPTISDELELFYSQQQDKYCKLSDFEKIKFRQKLNNTSVQECRALIEDLSDSSLIELHKIYRLVAVVNQEALDTDAGACRNKVLQELEKIMNEKSLPLRELISVNNLLSIHISSEKKQVHIEYPTCLENVFNKIFSNVSIMDDNILGQRILDLDLVDGFSNEYADALINELEQEKLNIMKQLAPSNDSDINMQPSLNELVIIIEQDCNAKSIANNEDFNTSQLIYYKQ